MQVKMFSVNKVNYLVEINNKCVSVKRYTVYNNKL